MELACQRCGVVLNPSELFCHNCGAPQLQIEVSEVVALDDKGVSEYAAAAPRGISWKAAIRVALIVFLPVALLSSVVNLSYLWVIGGGIAAVGIYRRRTAGLLDTRAGLRVGIVVGLLVAFSTSAVDAITMLVERFGRHNAREIDDRWNSMLQPMIQQMEQSYDQNVHNNPEAAAPIVSMIHFWQSPDGKAAGVLMAYAMLALGIIIFSALGGALGTRIFATRPPSFRRN